MGKSKKKQNRFLSSAVAFILCLSMLTEPVLATDSSGTTAANGNASTTQVDLLGGVGEFDDPNFEMGIGWKWVSNSEGTYKVCQDDDAQAAPVGQYLRIMSDGTVAPKMQWVSKEGEVEGKTNYVLKFYIKRNSDLCPYIVLAEKAGDAFTEIVTLNTRKNKTSGTMVSINGKEEVEKGKWTEVIYPFTTNENITQLRIRVVGGNPKDMAEDFCIDGITIFKNDGSVPIPTVAPPTPTPEPIPTYPPETWFDIMEGSGNFEDRAVFKDSTQWRWASTETTLGVAEYVPELETDEINPADESPAKGVYLRITGSGRDKDGDGNLDKPAVRWYSLTNGIYNGATYKLTMYIRRNSDHYPYITVANKYQSDPTNVLATVYTEGGKTNPDKNYISVLGDKDVPKGTWQKVECIFTTENLANKMMITIYGNDAEASFDMDGVSVVEIAPSKYGQEFVEWKERLAAEEANGMLASVTDDPTIRLDPIDGVANLLKNGDFKRGIANWAPNSTSGSLYQYAYWGTGLNEELTDSADDIIGPEGIDGVFMEDGSVQIYPSDARDPAFGQQLMDVEIDGGAEYQITFNYKIDAGSKSIPYVDIECFTNSPAPGEPENGYLGGVNAEWPADQYIADGKWHSFTYRLNLGVRVDWVEFFVRQHKNGDGNVYFDDCTFSKTGGAAKVALNKDMKIFYTDMQSENTEFEATVDTTYYPEYKDGTVVFHVYKDKDEIWKSESVGVEDNTASVTFPLSLLTEKDTPYCVIARLYVAGELVADDGRNVFMYDRPATLDESGRFVKFGEDFVPVLGYHVKNGEDPVDNAKITEINANVIQCGYGKRPHEIIKELDLLHETGQKGLVCLYTNMLPAGHDDNAIRTIEIITNEEIKNHPALFAYNVMDEPFVHQLDPRQDMENTYRLIRQYDQDTIITFVEAMEDYAYETSAYVDALISNPYWRAAGANVYKDTKLVEDSLNFNKPVWGLFATYILDGRKTEGKGYFNDADDVRNNNYQGLLAGLEGYGYFSLSDAGNVEYKDLDQIPEWANITWASSEGYIPLWEVQSPTDPEAGAKVWEALKSFEAVEAPIIAPYFIQKKGTKVSEEINIDGGYMYHAWKAEDGTDYMVVLNVKGDDVRVDIPVEKACAEIIAGREHEQFKARNGKLRLDLKNVEALLLKLTDTPGEATASGNTVLWVALLGVCVILAAGGVIFIKRRKTAKKSN